MVSSLNIKKTLTNIPQTVKNGVFPLEKIKLENIEGIQKKIPLFDYRDKLISLKDIAFISKGLETLNLFRGCDIGCTHCLKNAIHGAKSSRSILFEDLLRFTEGFKTLSERLGFNILNGNKYLNIIDDSNPIDYPINGITGKHSVVEAIKLIFDNLRLPILFVTSGWNKKSTYSQTTAEQLAREFKYNPQSLESFEVSINPFSEIMESSRLALKQNNSERADFLRGIYTDRMVNVLLTFFDLFKGENPKGILIYRHANNFKGNELVGEGETKKLYIEIYKKLKEFLGDRIEEAPTLEPDFVTKFDKSHLIEPSGRGRRYFPYNYNMELQSELIAEAEKWNTMSAEEKTAFLKDYSIKCVDINGQIYSTFPAINVHSENVPIELTVPTDIILNYSDQKKTAPIFSDIEL